MVPARTEWPDYAADSTNSVITVSYAGLTTTNGKGQRQVETRNALDEVVRTADHAGTTVTHGYDGGEDEHVGDGDERRNGDDDLRRGRRWRRRRQPGAMTLTTG